MTTFSIAAEPRTAGHILAKARNIVEPVHRDAVDRLPISVRRLVGYHIGWWDAAELPNTTAGKSLRPALVLAAASAVGGDPGAGVLEAVAVELVHDFSLLHDDIMDGDLMRRQRSSAWSRFGTGEALLAGDFLLALATDLLAARSDVKVLTAAVLELCAGQAADIAFERRDDVEVAECVAMAEAKTGALLGCACELGALAGGGDGHRAALLGRFGRHLGLAFQLIDDVLGIWGDPAVTGKPVSSDLVSRKKSLPVVAAMASGTPAGDQLKDLYHRHREQEQTSVAVLADLVLTAGGRDWALSEADRQVSLAMASLAEAAPDAGAETDLMTLAAFMTGRDH